MSEMCKQREDQSVCVRKLVCVSQVSVWVCEEVSECWECVSHECVCE